MLFANLASKETRKWEPTVSETGSVADTANGVPGKLRHEKWRQSRNSAMLPWMR